MSIVDQFVDLTALAKLSFVGGVVIPLVIAAITTSKLGRANRQNIGLRADKEELKEQINVEKARVRDLADRIDNSSPQSVLSKLLKEYEDGNFSLYQAGIEQARGELSSWLKLADAVAFHDVATMIGHDRQSLRQKARSSVMVATGLGSEAFDKSALIALDAPDLDDVEWPVMPVEWLPSNMEHVDALDDLEDVCNELASLNHFALLLPLSARQCDIGVHSTTVDEDIKYRSIFLHAQLLSNIGKHQEAFDLIDLALSQEGRNQTQSTILTSKRVKASALAGLGRAQEAKEIMDDILPEMRTEFGEHHNSTFVAHNLAISIEIDLGNDCSSEAEEHCGLAASNFGKESRQFSIAMMLAMRANSLAGNFEQGLTIANELMEKERARFGETDYRYLAALEAMEKLKQVSERAIVEKSDSVDEQQSQS